MSHHKITMKPVRLLCFGPHKVPSNAFRRALTFRKMGFQVATFDPDNLEIWKMDGLRRIIRKSSITLYRKIVDRAFVASVIGFKPDLVFIEKGVALTPNSIRKVKTVAKCVVHYNPDDPFGDYGSGAWQNFIATIPEYDVHFVPKPENVSDYEQRGAQNVFTFDRAYDPELHRPVQLDEKERTRFACEVGFIGSCAPHRESMIARLVRDDIPVAIWGNGWAQGAEWDTLRACWRGPGQYEEDYVKAICGMGIALHFLRRENRDTQDSRSFEIPACGAFMLAERTADHQRFFVEGSEAEFFDTYEELITKIQYYLSHEQRRKEIAQNGLSRTQDSGYDFESRLKDIMERINCVFGGEV